MKRIVAIGLMALAAFAWGCGEEGDDPPPPPSLRGGYLAPTSPENIIHNLAVSYERREIEQYAKFLDPTFIFKFQAPDIPPGLQREYWNRDEDSTGTYDLFTTFEVSRISLDSGVFTVQDAGRLDDPGAKRIRLTHLKLEVNTFDGTTLLVVGDIQDMYFRRGSAAAGTDSTKWYLFEWHDQAGGANGPGRGWASPAEGLVLPATTTDVERTTWGNLKSRTW